MIEKGDLVRIHTQPKRIAQQGLVGTVGIVLEIGSGKAHLQAINLYGRTNGEGTIPIDCLEPEARVQWEKAAECYRSRQ